MTSPMNITFGYGNKTCVITIDVQGNDIAECLTFEGKRIQSLIERQIDMPDADYRFWDEKRKITIRRKF